MKRLIGILLCLAFAPLTVRAEYPDRPVVLVVPLAAGGPSDAVARSVAESLSKSLGKPVVVENKPGTDGAIGARAVIAAPADGYTLLLGLGSLGALPYLQNPPPYDVLRDLAPVATIGRFPFVLAVHSSMPATTVAELVAQAKAAPGGLFYASSTASEALAAAEFMKSAGIQMTRVPYKGSAQALPDLLAGHVHAMIAPIAPVAPAAKDSKLRLLAILSSARSSAAPDVPTLTEAGFPAVEVPTWQSVFAPASTPKAIVDRLNADIVTALKTEELRQKLAGVMLQVAPSTPEEMQARIKQEDSVWATFVRENNLNSRRVSYS